MAWQEDWEEELSTAIHEIAHALGYARSKFPDFRDAKGVRRGADAILKTWPDRQMRKDVSMIVRAPPPPCPDTARLHGTCSEVRRRKGGVAAV